MPIRLPLDELVAPVRQLRAAPSAARLARYSAALALLPLEPSEEDWRAFPHGSLVRAVYRLKIHKPGDSIQMRLGAQAQTLLVVACVADDAGTFERLQAASAPARAVVDAKPSSVLVWQQGCEPGASVAALNAAIAALQAAVFQLPSFKSNPVSRARSARARSPRARLMRIDLLGAARLAQLDATLAAAAGNNLARWLTSLPPNILDASSYRRLLQQYGKRLGLGFRFYGEAQLRRLGAGAFLAVSSGNAKRDAGIVHLSYRPRGKSAAVSLVGKGICFDTGGTNLKTHKGMLEMHTDMQGSAVALGSLHALTMLRSPGPVDCWLAITENRTGPLAYKPQDVVTAMNGTTIQVIHTDAEGRMVLADALSLAAVRKPRVIIDYATLTGACVYALTERYSGAFTNRMDSRDQIEAAGRDSGERVWCFPMDADFDADLDSQVADIVQCAVDGKGDHILAARFLNRFVPASIPWLHLDLSAGVRHGGLAHIGSQITGFGVRFTLQLLRSGWPAAGSAAAP